MTEAQKATMAPGDLLAIYQALDRVQAIIEFDLDGTVVSCLLYTPGAAALP